MLTQKVDTKSNFGKGWGIIIYCMAMFFLLIGYSIDGMNIVAPAFAEKYGYKYSDVLGLATYAGYVAVIAYFIFGWICSKMGARFTAVLCMLGAGFSYIAYGHSTTLVGYGVSLAFVVSFINGGAYIAGNALISQWFPKKKGLANGWTTMGHNLGSAFYVPMIAFLIGTYGFTNGTTFAACIAITIGIIGFFYLRNTPKERDIFPDNVSNEVYKREYFHSADHSGNDDKWSIPRLLRIKETWIVSIIIGINQLVTTGVMSQLVIRNIGLGFEKNTAIYIMTILACIGVIGSYSFGWLDAKVGTKNSIRVFLVWYSIALLFNITEIPVLIYVSFFMLGMAIGGAANFIGSLPISVFGRHGFACAFGIIFPVMSIILFSNYMINAISIDLTGSLKGAYCVFIGLLFINFFIVSMLNSTKYNKDYMVEISSNN